MEFIDVFFNSFQHVLCLVAFPR